ncbi:MAG: 50S ribosomal protein L10 [Acidimicrobiia bacterium]
MAPTGTERRERKVAVVEEIAAKLDEADASVLTEYRGLTVTEIAELRGALRPAGTEYKIFKNTLARRAVESAGRQDLLPLLEGPVAIAFVRGDAVVAAKALRDFGRGNPALVVKGGLLGGELLTASEVQALAEVPPRDVLLATMAGAFQAPLVKAAGLFQAFTRNFAYGLQALIDERGGAAAEEETAVAETYAEAADAAAGEAETEVEAAAETAADE